MKNRGFTIIELLVVIAIAGIIIGFATVGIFKFKDNSNKSALNNKINAIENATLNYAINNSNKLKNELEKKYNTLCNRNINNYCTCQNGECFYKYDASINYIVDNSIYKEKNNNDSCSVVDPTTDDCLMGHVEILMSSTYENNIKVKFKFDN